MLRGEWCLNTKTGRFLRVEVGAGFPGRRDDVCKGTELSDSRKSSGDPFRLPCSRTTWMEAGEEESFFPKSGLSGSKCPPNGTM